ncbi:LysR family transcriptional regulator [Telmatospirillum sp. J64-1]|uniref:LysR family transcriptional regulator n=1 Tax=Telmatospirillum sp. J64-1 TaxID=2502183 RepID=UPI00115E8D80|nr:LysR family transcriptional regulator [Telmatospirillum sp. J64-1]
MNLSLRALSYFVAAAEESSVTAAAQRLNISQPSISAAVAQLEQQLSVQLFIRHHAKGLSLTPSGQRVLNEARALLKHAEEFRVSAGMLGEGLQGNVELGCFSTLAPIIIPGLLSALGSQLPGITLTVSEGNQEEMLEGILSGRIELALTYDLAVTDEFHTQLLAEFPPQVVVARSHPLAQRKSVRLAEIASEPFILLDLPHSRNYFTGLFHQCGVEPRIQHQSKSYELVRGLVGRGLGFSILNVTPRLNMTYDGKEIVILPIEEDLPPTRLVSLRLKRLAVRKPVMAVERCTQCILSAILGEKEFSTLCDGPLH